MKLTHPNFSDRAPELKIKVCGLRMPDNIEAVAELPIDMIGLIFYEKSPRYINADGFKDLKNVDQTRVGVFVNAETSYVLEKVGAFELEFVQLHGDESAEYCQDLKSVWPSIKIIKAFSVDEDFDFNITKAYEHAVEFFLFDTKGKNRGGNGKIFNWELLKKYEGNRQFYLSGGIGLEHAESISKLYFPKLVGIDLNSKFEIAPGLKDVEKLKQFLSKLKNA